MLAHYPYPRIVFVTFDFLPQMRTAVGKVLKDAVNLPCCNPEVWGLLGRYYSLTGQLEGAKEALLKQVSTPCLLR
eukprot:1144571-Pelagomonas_calceolata.AAC.6